MDWAWTTQIQNNVDIFYMLIFKRKPKWRILQNVLKWREMAVEHSHINTNTTEAEAFLCLQLNYRNQQRDCDSGMFWNQLVQVEKTKWHNINILSVDSKMNWSLLYCLRCLRCIVGEACNSGSFHTFFVRKFLPNSSKLDLSGPFVISW